MLTGLLSPAEQGQQSASVPVSLLERAASSVGAGALVRPDLGAALDYTPTRAVAWDPRQRRLAGEPHRVAQCQTPPSDAALACRQSSTHRTGCPSTASSLAPWNSKVTRRVGLGTVSADRLTDSC